MRARAEATEETRRRILQAAFDLTWDMLLLEITLDGVADRAGVSVQTVLRHFSSRERLFDAVEAFASQIVSEERAAPSGGVDAAVSALFNHYELRGDAVMRMLGQELWDERIRRLADHGRRGHRQWVERAFATQLDARSAGDREALVDLLVVATDVYTWKLLRRDRVLRRGVAEQRVRDLIAAVLMTAPEVG
jgi:AcrR family transcriptional regulator